MKKITLLFATMLAMSGMSFGQNQAKVLWEQVVDTISVGAYINTVGDNPTISPSGNILIQYNWYLDNNIRKTGVKTYDKNGNILWNATDFYKNPLPYFSANVIANYTLVDNYYYSVRGNSGITFDTTLYFDKDYKFLKRFYVSNPSAFFSNVRDGIFYNNITEKTLIKYDALGKEEWRYDSPDPIAIISQKPPYFGIPFSAPLDQRLIIILDKKGKKTGQIEPFGFVKSISTNDKGFWAQTGTYEYIKFDSTGKQTAKCSDFKGTYKDFNDTTLVLRDNSLLLSNTTNDGILLKKISSTGIVKDVNVAFPFKVNFSTFFKFKEIAPNTIMYSIAMPERDVESDIIYKIGVVNFDDVSKSWNKDIKGGASNGIAGNAITFEAENTFFLAYSDPNQPLLKTFKVYNINGNLTWSSPFSLGSPQGYIFWKIIDNHVYFTGTPNDSIRYSVGYGLKIRITDGKVIWKISHGISLGNIGNGVQKDKNGNEVIFYSEGYKDPTNPNLYGGEIYKIATLNSDGTDKWAYTVLKTIGSKYGYQDKILFRPTDDNSVIIYSLENRDNKLQQILRKISPCTALNAISLTGNTEACPTEKVKLSIQKQEGVTYQWQKDGKDLPNFKDAVYDIGETGTYTVKVKDEICQNQETSNALKINIRTLPSAEIKAPKTTFCDGDKTTITSTTNGVFFQWQKDQKDIPNATSGIFEASQAGDYRVGVRDDKCPQVGYSNTYTINVKPLPEASISTDIKTVIYEPFTVKMTANSGTNLSYQWLKDEVIIDNATTNVYEAKNSGKYKVSVTKDGCLKTSEALTISIQIPLGNEGEIGEETIQIYPNPNQGKFKLILPKTLQNADIQLFDILGRERSLVHTGEQAQADGLMQGVYFLRVNKGEKSIVNKIVIE